MKKGLLLSGIFITSSLFAASNQEIINFYKDQLGNTLPKAKFSITKREKVGDTGFESVLVVLEVDKMGKQEEILFTKDNIIAPDIIDIKSGISYKQLYEVKKMQEAQAKFEKNAKNELAKETQIIKLGENNKPKMYVFSDPECPYCRAHLSKQLQEDLKQYQVNFILTSIHGQSAFEKVALIYKESKNAKTDNEKIAILKKYYDENIKSYPKVSKEELNSAYKLSQKYKKLGLVAVPTIIKDEK